MSIILSTPQLDPRRSVNRATLEHNFYCYQGFPKVFGSMPRTQALAFAIRRRALASPSSRPRPRSSASTIEFFDHSSKPRCFTHRTSLLLVSRPSPRAQLPFLHPSSSHSVVSKVTLRTQLSRYISTERRRRWKERLRWQLRFHAYFWPLAILSGLLYTGVQQTKIEQRYPTPREWSFWSRWYARTARYTEFDDDAKISRVLTDWQDAGARYVALLERLEDENIDGKHLISQGDDGGGILVEGVGRTGFDVSAKSEPWRRGYYEALIGLARVAEHLDGMARRKGDKELLTARLFPWDSIPGPNNPRPKPLPWDKRGDYLHPPTDFECENAFDGPEVYYMKILTTRGFSTRERLDAALGYADWCDFKGLKDTAGNMYDWALDIAAGALPQDAQNVVDMQTGVINSGKEEYASENLLKATTALGVHHAKNGEVKEALPIFLSVLRARKSLPALPVALQKKANAPMKEESPLVSSLLTTFGFFFESPYPRAPSSGDERPFHDLKEACEEVGLMTYIGEILFATSDQEREKGLSWTRDSVEAAEAVLWFMDERGFGEDEQGRKRCQECLETGLLNWQQMARQMARLAKKKEQDLQKSNGWLGLGLGREAALDKAIEETKRWKEEESQIELRRQKTASLINPLKPVGDFFASV